MALPLPQALNHHLFPRGELDLGVGAYTGKDGFQSCQKAEETVESLGKPHPDKDVALRMFAISSSRCQS